MPEPSASPCFRSITARELAARLEAGAAPRIIDIREPHERALARLPGAESLPLSEIRDWWTALDPSEELVFHCHHGMRSAALCRVLAAQGFSRLYNLAGGIDAWSTEVDPALPRY